MTPRRLLLLAAALLLVQLGGLLHGLSHLGEHDHDGEPPAACEWCLAYAGLDHGLSSQPPALRASTSPPPVERAAPRPFSVRAEFPYRSRAPPARLA